MSTVLKGLTGVTCLMDDILIHGSNQQELVECLIAVLWLLQKFYVSLNKMKCVFSTSSVKFLGHVIDKEGLQSDPEKVQTSSLK